MSVVGAPAYFASRPAPQGPQDLTAHSGINLRLPTNGEIFTWTFQKGAKSQRIRCDGSLVFNSLSPILSAALGGFGLAWLPEPMVRAQVASGLLVPVLEDWVQTYEGYHLYYPHRRHATSAFSLLVKTLRVEK
nr:LysR substrate-binding domain-containing protein [Cupriavidus basilensis]